METFENIKRLRENLNMSQTELAELVGYKDRSSIAKIESGKVDLAQSKIAAFAAALHVSPAFLMGISEDPELPANVIPMPNFKRLPLIGEVCAGEGTIANPEFEEYVTAPDWVHADFALRCKGDSMTGARIYDGDMVYIRRQETVEPGEIAAVQIGEEALLKRVYYSGETIILQPENPQYAPIIVNPKEDSGFHIIGKAVAFTSTIV